MNKLTARGLSLPELARIKAHRFLNPHAWWVPTGGQEDFLIQLDRIGDSCRDATLFGGNGVGKTSAMANIALGLTLPKIYNPFLQKRKFFTDTSWTLHLGPNGSLNIVAILRRDQAANVFVPELKKWAPKGSYVTTRGDKKFDYLWEFNNGGRLTIFTPDQDVRQFEGWNIDVILSDEQFDMAIYDEGFQRLRGMGCWLAFMTPLYTAGEYVDMLMSIKEENRIVVTLHKESACKKHGVRGFRDHKAILEDIRKCDPEQYEARVEGKPMHLVGKVYKQFKHNFHVIPETEVEEILKGGEFTLYAACDPHENRPNFMGWAAVLPDKRTIWIDEWPEWDPGLIEEPHLGDNPLRFYLSPRLAPYHKIKDMRMTPSEFCEVVKAKETELKAKFGQEVYYRFVDPRFSSRTSGGRISLRSVYHRQGLMFYPALAEKDLIVRHSTLRQLLTGYYDEKNDRDVPAKLFFSSRCRNLIHQISNYAYAKEIRRGGYTGKWTESVQETYKDGADVVAYLMMKNPCYISKEAESVGETVSVYKVSRRKNHAYGIFSGM